jgi:hypothetical protein
MSRIETALRAVVAALEARQVRFALVGGLAVSARTEPRFTRDVDIAVAVENDGQAEALVHSLVRTGYAIIAAVEQDQTKRLATVRLFPPGAELAHPERSKREDHIRNARTLASWAATARQ